MDYIVGGGGNIQVTLVTSQRTSSSSILVRTEDVLTNMPVDSISRHICIVDISSLRKLSKSKCKKHTEFSIC